MGNTKPDIPQEMVEKAAKALRQTDSASRLMSESMLDAERILEAAGVGELIAEREALRTRLDEQLIATRDLSFDLSDARRELEIGQRAMQVSAVDLGALRRRIQALEEELRAPAAKAIDRGALSAYESETKR